MQTTLLGLAIAFILALAAALVGPFFIDWNQFRPQFEAEATRIIGAPVRVTGALEARLLPAPSLQLHGITVGGANDLGRMRAQKLAVEFSLGSLMRGEWRATELSIGGAAVDLGLNAEGRLDLPASTGPFNLGDLAIDRLNVTGRLALHDAASRTSLELNDVVFSGDVRSLAAGALRGDGNFMLSGMRYPFRLSSGQTGDGLGTRMRLTIDPGEKPLSVDLDGVLAFDNRAPSFEGTMAVASNVPAQSDKPATAPWRIAGKLKLAPAQARLESVEASYGSDNAALKFSGIADLRFGSAPLLTAVLAGKQLDVDRLLAKGGGGDDGLTPIAQLRRLIAIVPPPSIATQLQMSADQMMLGGRAVQNIGVDLHGDAKSWAVERLELQAPGATRVIASGASQSNVANSFSGAINVDSADPDVLVGWLKGRNDTRLRDQKPLRIRGHFASTNDRLSVDKLNAEIDGGVLEGRIALSYPSAAGGSRLDANLKADRLDLDAATALVRSLAGSQTEWPKAGTLALDIGRAISAGQEMRPFSVQVGYDPKTLSLDRFKVGEPAGLMLDGSGAFDRNDVTGKLTLSASASSLAQATNVLAPLAPKLAERLKAVPAVTGGVKLKLGLDVAKADPASDRAYASVVLDIDAPQVKGTISSKASPTLAALRGFDVAALSGSEFVWDARLTGQGRTLLAFLELGHVVAAGDAPLTFEGNATGALRAPMQVKAKLSGTELDADVHGSAELLATVPKASLVLAIRAANAAPLFGLKPADALAQRMSLSSRVSLNGEKLSFEDIDSTFAGSRMRGRLALTLGAEKSIDGQLGADRIDLAQAFGFAIGARGQDASEPLSRDLLQGWRGQLAFQALSAVLPGGSEIRPFNTIVRSNGQSLTLDAMTGKIGGGDVTADIDLTRSATTGYTLGVRAQLAGVDGAALRYQSLAMPTGKTSLRMTLSSQGRSASALAGAISGDGLVTIDQLRIAGLDPRAFDAAIRASDTGVATNDAKLRQIVELELGRGEFAVASAQIPFSIKDSRLRVGATSLEAEGAQAIVSGGYDIVAEQADMRANLSRPASGGSSARPEIQLFLMGPPDRLDRTVDVGALSSWLAVRAIDRETRRLDLLERGPAAPIIVSPPADSVPSINDLTTSSAPNLQDVPLPGKDPRRAPVRPVAPRPPSAAAVPPVSSQQMAPLPAPIDVKPAPGTARAAPRPRPSGPLVLTPPTAAPSARPTF